MKKRSIISIILTVVAIIGAHSIWHHASPLIFISITILSFLLIYKITDYVADFKTLKNKSRADIIFLLIFFIFLCVPMSHIDKRAKSDTENRYLAQKPVFIKKHKLNYDYGKEFNNWFNDRFFLRKELINLFYNMQACLSPNYFDNQKMFFVKSSNFIGAKYIMPSSKYFSKKDVDETVQSIDKINDYCKKNNIKFYIMIVPHNQFIYQDIIKPFDSPVEVKNVNEAIYSLQQKSDAKIIYPFDELKSAAKNDWVFFKTDHHWTDVGAFVSYKALINEVKKDFPDVKEVKESDFNIKESNLVRANFSRKFNEGNQFRGAGFFLLPQKDKILDTKYKYFYHKNKDMLKSTITVNDTMKSKDTIYPYGSDYKVLELGNSVNENILQFISYTFRQVKYFRLVQGETKIKGKDIDKVIKNYGKEIEQFKPDIIIYCTTYMRLKNLKYFFEEE